MTTQPLSVQLKALEDQAKQAEMCRATLYANFVVQETRGVQIPREQAEAMSTHQLMLEILLLLTEKT